MQSRKAAIKGIVSIFPGVGTDFGICVFTVFSSSVPLVTVEQAAQASHAIYQPSG